MMFIFISGAALIVAVGNIVFHQGQENPHAQSFFISKSSTFHTDQE